MSTIFHRISTGERFVIQHDGKRAQDMAVALLQDKFQADDTSGRKINVCFFDWSSKAVNQNWEMISSDGRSPDRVIARGSFIIRWFAPTNRPTETAIVDTKMDGGTEKSMGMLKQ